VTYDIASLNPPKPVSELLEALLGEGFTITHSLRSGMGGLEMDLCAPSVEQLEPTKIRISADRGHWVALICVRSGVWINPETWWRTRRSEAIDGHHVETQASVLKDHWRDIESEALVDPEMPIHLKELGREYMRQQLMND
jgi:hypothetical protein